MRKADRRAAIKNEEWGHSEKEWLKPSEKQMGFV